MSKICVIAVARNIAILAAKLSVGNVNHVIDTLLTTGSKRRCILGSSSSNKSRDTKSELHFVVQEVNGEESKEFYVGREAQLGNKAKGQG